MTDTSRGSLVRMALDVLQDLTTRPPVLTVPWADFPLWLAHLGANEVGCRLRYDGLLLVEATEPVKDWGLITVSTVVESVRGVEVPFSGEARIPVTELDRCVPVGKAVA